MRVLLVGAAPDHGQRDLLEAWAAEADLVIAIDGGASHCLAAGVRPDLVVGDLDSLDAATRLALEHAGVPIERHPSEKDQTDLELALDTARRAGADRLDVTLVTGGRLDHELASLGALAGAADLWPHLVEAHVEGWILSTSGRAILELPAAGTRFSVLALDGPSRVTVTGVRWPLEDAELMPLSTLGVSNRTLDEKALVKVGAGTPIVIIDKRT